MAILNFPDAAGQPIDGSFTYEDNGVLYSWDGYKWNANSEQAYDDKYVEVTGDTMTGDLTVPNLISEGDVQTTSLNGGPLSGLRNQLINGDFRVWQRGTPVTVSGPTGIGYGPDRWRASINGTTMTRGTGLGVNYPGAFGVRVNVSGGASCSIAQPIELPQAGHFGPFTPGSSWTLSAYFEDPSTASFNVLFATGAVGPGEVWAGGPVKTLDTANGKTRVSQTFVVPSSMDGSRTSCLVVLQDSVNNRVFAQAQFEPGPVATPFEQRPIGLELSLCQRYYQSHLVSLPMISTSNGNRERGIRCPRVCEMRAAPTESGTSGNGVITTMAGTAGSIVLQGTANGDGESMAITLTADAEL